MGAFSWSEGIERTAMLKRDGSESIVILPMRTVGEHDSLMKFWAWDKKNLPSITHAIRMAVAATVSVIIAQLAQMPEAYWAAIATLVVIGGA